MDRYICGLFMFCQILITRKYVQSIKNILSNESALKLLLLFFLINFIVNLFSFTYYIGNYRYLGEFKSDPYNTIKIQALEIFLENVLTPDKTGLFISNHRQIF